MFFSSNKDKMLKKKVIIDKNEKTLTEKTFQKICISLPKKPILFSKPQIIFLTVTTSLELVNYNKPNSIEIRPKPKLKTKKLT